MNEIIVSDAVKKYKETVALNHVSLTIEHGKIYGLFGRNGAGKSTLIKAIGNKVFLNDGTITINGIANIDNQIALQNIWIMNESITMPAYKIKEIFKWSKVYNPQFDLEYAVRLCKLFNLNVNKKYNSLSTGYTSILKFILAMCSNAPYIFLDEPVLGLDFVHREYVYKIILEVQMKKMCTIIISTHIIEEISNIIENVIIINDGEILENIQKDELIKQYYLVNGSIESVKDFIVEKEVITSQYLGNLANVLIKGEMPISNLDDLTFSRIDLQQIAARISKIKEGQDYENFSNI